MAQFARPDGDLTTSGWNWATSTASGATDLYLVIDEVILNITDNVQSSGVTAPNFYECTLGDVTDPAVSTGHVVRYHIKKNTSAGKTIDTLVELRQGATVVASWNHPNMSEVATQHNQTLTAAQADAITDYSDLRLRFTITHIGSGQYRALYLHWAEFEVPDAGGTPPVPVSPPGAFFPFFP